MKIKRFCWLLLLSGLCLVSASRAEEVKSPEDYGKWVGRFYHNHDPGSFSGYWTMVMAKGMLEDRNQIQPVLGFTNRILHQHPDLLKNRFDDFSQFPKKQRATIARLLWLSDTPEARQILHAQGFDAYSDQAVAPIENWVIKGAQDLDFCWGWFFATGDTGAITPIVAALDLGKDAGALKHYETSAKTAADRQAAYNDACFGAAAWSLTSLGKTDENVARFLERQFKDASTPEARKTWLAMILSNVFPGKYQIKVAAGKDQTGLDWPALDRALAEVAQRAKNYPPKFTSVEERENTEKRLRDIISRLDAALMSSPDDRDLLRRAGVANSLGHNLDFPESGKRCAEVYDHLLELDPDDGRAHLHYGIFLAGSGRPKEGLPHLERALQLGPREANYSLAITYLTMADKEKAIDHLKQFTADFPRDANAQKLLEAMRSDDSKIVQKDLPPGGRRSSSSSVSGVEQP